VGVVGTSTARSSLPFSTHNLETIHAAVLLLLLLLLLLWLWLGWLLTLRHRLGCIPCQDACRPSCGCCIRCGHGS
jgi:hypothetical protein